MGIEEIILDERRVLNAVVETTRQMIQKNLPQDHDPILRIANYIRTEGKLVNTKDMHDILRDPVIKNLVRPVENAYIERNQVFNSAYILTTSVCSIVIGVLVKSVPLAALSWLVFQFCYFGVQTAKSMENEGKDCAFSDIKKRYCEAALELYNSIPLPDFGSALKRGLESVRPILKERGYV